MSSSVPEVTTPKPGYVISVEANHQGTAPGLGLGLDDKLNDGDIDFDTDGLILALPEIDGLTLADCEILGLTEGDIEGDADFETDGLTLGLCEIEGETDFEAEGETEGDADGL